MFRGSVERFFILCAICLSFTGIRPLSAANWLPFGPDGGDARRVVADPSDHTHLYLGTANGWIYDSHTSGANWRRLARVGKRDDLVLDSILVDSQNPKHLVVGAWVIDHPDGGLYVSVDGGVTWANQADMRGQSVRALAASPSDGNSLVAGTLTGVFRSADRGQHWKLISPAESKEIHEIESVAVDPVDPNVIYAGTWHLPWKTSDGGEHWENIKDGIIDDSDVFSIIVDPTNRLTVYASACSGIYKSENAGVLFHKVQGIPSSARRTRVLMQDPNNLAIVFAGTTEGLFRSQDSGRTWSRTTGPEVIVNDVAIDRSDSNHVVLATDRGGVLSSMDGGDTFHSSNAGFSARQITAIKRDALHASIVLAGVVNDKEWGGVFRSMNGGLSWAQRSEGLQGRDVLALGQSPDGTMIAGTSHGLFRMPQDAETWARSSGPASPTNTNAQQVTSSAVVLRAPVPIQRNLFAKRRHPLINKVGKDRKRVFASTQRPIPHKASHPAPKRTIAKQKQHPAANKLAVSSSHEAAKAAETPKEALAPPLFDGNVYGLATTAKSILAASSAGLLVSLDEGLTWQLAGSTRSSDWRYLASARDNVVAASLHSLSFSSDAGATWSPMLLPEGLTQVSAVAVEPSAEIWVGGREGVFVSSDAGHTWTTPKNLFVNTVNSIFWDEATNRILITTGGYSDLVFTVSLPGMKVTFYDTGWNLRFARPMGDHLLAATLFDGLVIEPKMIDLPLPVDSAGKTVPQDAPARQIEVPVAPPTAGVPAVQVIHLPGMPQ